MTAAILIGLGSNLPARRFGGPVAVLDAAVAAIARTIADIVRRSRWFWSTPLPAAAQPLCVNGVVALAACGLPADELLARLHAIEADFGRLRSQPNAARVLDLDLLAFGDRVLRTAAGLILPHPRLEQRAFVLRPLAEIAPDWRHPLSGQTAAALLAGCGGQWLQPMASAPPPAGGCKAASTGYLVATHRHLGTGTLPMHEAPAAANTDSSANAAATSQSAPPGPPAATDPAAYSFFTRDVVRFSDIDRYRHINNVATATYCETGRVEFAEFLAPGSTSGDNDGWVIASLKVNFLAMAYYPGDVVVGSRVEHIGRSSCRLGQGLFKDGVCFATAEAVLVWVDMAAGGRASPIPAALVERLRQHMT